MMTVAPVIELRNLASQLTEAERQAFINKLAVTHSELIIHTLSTYFIHQSTIENAADSSNEKCIEIISNIIQSRDTDDVAQESRKLDSLPRRLIGAGGSFLDQKSYAALSRCNRSTYLGCNTPNVLTDLDVDYNQSNLDLSKFPFARKLTLCIDRFESRRQYSIAEQVAEMPRLQCLDLRRVHLCFIGMLADQQAICDRIRSLAVSRSIGYITAFKNIEYLKLYHVKHLFGSDAEAAADAFGKLKGFDLEEHAIYGTGYLLLKALGHRLQYLRLRTMDYREDKKLENIQFVNLRQFRVHEIHPGNIGVVHAVIQTATKLEKIQINIAKNDINRDVRLQLMEDILSKCKRLYYMEIKAHNANGTESFLGAVERGLRNVKRDTLTIRFIGGLRLGESRTEAMKRVINVLLTQVNQWTIILPQSTSGLSAVVDTMSPRIHLLRGDRYARLSNKGCNISSGREMWMMED